MKDFNFIVICFDARVKYYMIGLYYKKSHIEQYGFFKAIKTTN